MTSIFKLKMAAERACRVQRKRNVNMINNYNTTPTPTVEDTTTIGTRYTAKVQALTESHGGFRAYMGCGIRF